MPYLSPVLPTMAHPPCVADQAADSYLQALTRWASTNNGANAAQNAMLLQQLTAFCNNTSATVATLELDLLGVTALPPLPGAGLGPQLDTLVLRNFNLRAIAGQSGAAVVQDINTFLRAHGTQTLALKECELPHNAAQPSQRGSLRSIFERLVEASPVTTVNVRPDFACGSYSSLPSLRINKATQEPLSNGQPCWVHFKSRNPIRSLVSHAHMHVMARHFRRAASEEASEEGGLLANAPRPIGRRLAVASGQQQRMLREHAEVLSSMRPFAQEHGYKRFMALIQRLMCPVALDGQMLSQPLVDRSQIAMLISAIEQDECARRKVFEMAPRAEACDHDNVLTALGDIQDYLEFKRLSQQMSAGDPQLTAYAKTIAAKQFVAQLIADEEGEEHGTQAAGLMLRECLQSDLKLPHPTKARYSSRAQVSQAQVKSALYGVQARLTNSRDTAQAMIKQPGWHELMLSLVGDSIEDCNKSALAALQGLDALGLPDPQHREQVEQIKQDREAKLHAICLDKTTELLSQLSLCGRDPYQWDERGTSLDPV